MGDQNQSGANGINGGDVVEGAVLAAAEPVRTRWTPKPEQILILESIFNSGMVNPPKDETVRIRKLLERFGPVGDANVFYWFQNRRSRSRRRQRQMQAAGDPARNVSSAGIPSTGATAGGATEAAHSPSTSFSININSSTRSPVGFVSPPTSTAATGCPSPSLLPDDGAEDLFSISRQMRIRDMSNTDHTRMMYPAPPVDLTGHSSSTAAVSSCAYHSGLISVFINGSLQEVPRGPFDVRAVFGQDVMLLIHSSGELLPLNEYGILFQGLFPGESYFLVPRSM